MNSRISVGLVMVAALVLSLVPAATISAQPAEAASTCDWAQFVADVTIPDGTSLAPGAAFTKTWRLKNIGTCTWTTSYALVYSSGDQMGGVSPASFSNSVAPGQTVDIAVNLTAPSTAGHHIGYWKFKNAAGVQFGIGSTANSAWWVEINVTGGTTPAGVAYDFVANRCSANWYSSQGSLPCAGTEGDARGFVIAVNQPQLENGSTDPGVGLLTVPQNAYNGDIHGAFPAFHVQSGDHFQSIVNCAYGATGCDVIFRLDYQIGSGPLTTFSSFGQKYDGLYSRVDVDLSSLAGQDVNFILTVLANGSATGDRALWVNPAITRTGSTPPTPNARNFDFGTATSPVAPGYVRVTEATAYTTGTYGWTTASGAQSVDRSSQADPLKRDFVMSGTTAPTFMVNLPNGNYAVTVTMGDNDAPHDNMVVKVNGSVMLPDVDTAAGSFAVNTFVVTVSAGSLTMQFLDSGGNDSTWVVNGVSIAATSQPPTACGRAQFVADVTVPDGTVFAPGSAFTKTWRLKNVSTCTWTTFYAMVFDTGEKMGGADLVNLPHNVAPGGTVDMSVNLTAPSTAGAYRGYWKFQDANGVRFGLGTDGTKSWWVDIKVSGTTATSTPTATPATTVTATTTATGTPTQPVTSTPIPSATATTTPGPPTPTLPPSGCDRAQFIADVTVPDGTVFAPGAQFDKIWRLKNVGTCTWTTSYAMVFDIGEKMGGPDSLAMPVAVPPGSTVDLLVHLTAPSIAGAYRGYWKFQNASGVRFGLGSAGTKSWWVDIKVSGTTITPTPTATLPMTGTPTVTPTPTITPGTPTPTQPPSGCDRAQFVADVTVPDGSVFAPGAAFTKTWRLKNVGTCTWTTAYGMVFDSGAKMSGPDSVSMPGTVTPGSAVDVSVNLIAPTAAGSYRGYWRFQNASGVRFGLGSSGTSSWWVDIRVSGTTVTPTPTATGTTGWATYANSKYSFSFKYPPGSSIESQSDNAGRVNLPFTGGTTLTGKWVDVTVVEGASPCKSPNAGQVSSAQNVTINGIQFLKELGGEGTAGHFYDITAYSTLRNNACISMTFVLKSVDPGVFATPPPAYNKAAESGVFQTIMSTFVFTSPPATATNTPPASTSTPTRTPSATPTATGTDTTGWNVYSNAKYGFSFKYPPGSTVVSQSDTGGRINLPFASGTNLLEKHLDVGIVEDVSYCKSPQSQGPNPAIHTENVTFNGIPFLKETWVEGATSHRADYTAYSTAKGHACISMTFWLWSVVPEVMETPPPRFDPVAESAVFTTIMSTYTNQ